MRKLLAVSTLLAVAVLGYGWRGRPVAHAQAFATCVSAATAPACNSAQSGIVTIAAAASSVVVNTTAVTANARILLGYDASLGSLLSVTCNTTAQLPYVSARSAGLSFTISTASTFTTNPGCIVFQVVNQ